LAVQFIDLFPQFFQRHISLVLFLAVPVPWADSILCTPPGRMATKNELNRTVR